MERQLHKKVADLTSQVKVLEKRLGLFKLENQTLVSRQHNFFSFSILIFLIFMFSFFIFRFHFFFKLFCFILY